MSPLVSFARGGSFAGAVLLLASAAEAAPPTKDDCVDAHGKGQDAREAGQLAQAGRLFLLCADAACPDLVRGDCARFADEIQRLQPSVTFAARDGAQRDLADTAVYVDGTLVAPRLGDGKAHDIDPGHHEVRFVHAGKEVLVEVVVNQGEKGRAVVGTFASPAAQAGGSAAAQVGGPTVAPDTPELKRPAAPLVLVGLGAAAVAAGGALLTIGLVRIPSNCSLTTHLCAAAPGDPAFGKAASGVTLVNLGTLVGGAGALLFGGSMIGYFAQAPRQVKSAWLSPWAGPGGGGLQVSGSL
jgi:hypothetical protein